MPSEHYDIIIIGSGAGGGTMARALSDCGARILVVERGDFVPREAGNWDPTAVWRDLRYRTREQWLDGTGQPFTPYTHYCVGGNTKFWGTVLYRLRQQDFQAVEHADGVSPAWPISYDDLAPYYDRAERLYHVHGAVGDDPTEPPRGPFPYQAVPHASGMSRIADQLRGLGLHPSPLPLGLIDPGSGGCVLCQTCNSFPCLIDKKSDADVCGIRPATARSNVTLRTGAFAERVLTDPAGRRVEAIEIRGADGERRRIEAPLVILSAGAVNSAALLLRSASSRHPNGLANSSDLVGRHYMAHLSTMLEGFRARLATNTDVFQKTLAVNDFYLRGPGGRPLGQIQSQGRTSPVMAKVVGDSWTYKGIEMRHIPLWAYHEWVTRATDWLAMTEDLPDPDNRVRLAPDGRIVLDVRQNNLRAHAMLVGKLREILRSLGYWSPKVFAHMAGTKNTTHQCGTIVFGRDPQTSVLDPFCRAHDVSNLFVVDASFFPSSAAVNPGLTIAAQALRVADHILNTQRPTPNAQSL